MSLNIDVLLFAAEFLERREQDHGYASSHPVPDDLMHQTNNNNSKNKSKPQKKSQGSRSVHNQMEKARRSHLRGCLDKLKELVPLGTDSSRHTTLGLLKKAQLFIRSLETIDRKQRSNKQQLIREHRHLLRRLEQISEEAGVTCPTKSSTHRARSISESSSGISSASTSPTSEVGDMDIDLRSNESDGFDFLPMSL